MAWKHPHLGTEDHISYFALNDEVSPTGDRDFDFPYLLKSLPSSKQKSHLGLSFKLVTSQVAIFQYCLKQMFTKCLQFPCAQQQGVRKSQKTSHNFFQLQRTLWDVKSPRNGPKPMPWAKKVGWKIQQEFHWTMMAGSVYMSTWIHWKFKKQ